MRPKHSHPARLEQVEEAKMHAARRISPTRSVAQARRPRPRPRADTSAAIKAFPDLWILTMFSRGLLTVAAFWMLFLYAGAHPGFLSS